jgi:hypothetical protein
MSAYDMKLVNEESVSAVTGTPSVDLGTIRFKDGIEYMYMHNGSSGAVNQGSPVLITASTGYTFVVTYAQIDTVTAAAGYGFAFAGTLHNATMPSAALYGWVARRGLINCRPESSAIAAGDAVMIKNGGGAVIARSGITDTATAAELCSFVVNPTVGQAMEAATAAATGVIKVYVR